MYITYPQPNGQVTVVFPFGDVNGAIKDIPEGVEYKIVESVEIDVFMQKIKRQIQINNNDFEVDFD